MPTFTTGATSPAPVTAAGYLTYSANAARRMLVRELGYSTTSAVASSIGYGLAGNTPVQTTSITAQAHDVADATAVSTLGTAWSTAPTTPAVFMRKFTLGAAVGAGVIWKLALDERIILAKSAFHVAWNYGASTASALDSYCESDE